MAKDLEYLPRRLPCEDGRLRMIYVRGHWDKARWSETPEPDGRVPAYRSTTLANRRSVHIPGYVSGGVFRAKSEVTA